ncbi:hypothetical protein [Oricola sp.]|uniref:hypothetical protein n=1 Tax=Oricola sp. TaxID=1979950 RepID=UPI003BA8ECE5
MIGRGAFNGDVVNAHALNGGIFVLEAASIANAAIGVAALASQRHRAGAALATAIEPGPVATRTRCGAAALSADLDVIARATRIGLAGASMTTLLDVGAGATIIKCAAAGLSVTVAGAGTLAWHRLFNAPLSRTAFPSGNHREAVQRREPRVAVVTPDNDAKQPERRRSA